MHIEFLVEELSAEMALKILIPRIVGEAISFNIHTHQGKGDLLSKLPRRLKGYRKWLPPDWRIVVMCDRDHEDCRALKQQMDRAAVEAGLITKSNPDSGNRYQVVTRLLIEELEAWFFGDVSALVAAYPGVDRALEERPEYQDPDDIPGGTWEALERELQRAGYYPAGLAKVQAARDIAAYMDPARNRSRSFQVFRACLIEMVG